MREPLTKNLHPQGDFYGERRLPEFSVGGYSDERGASHRLFVRGRFLECSIHDDPSVQAMSFGDSESAATCKELAHQWHDSFKSGNFVTPGATTNLPYERTPALHEAHNHVTATMLQEMGLHADASYHALRKLYNAFPQLATDPSFAKEHQDLNLPPDIWSILKRSNTIWLAPLVRANLALYRGQSTNITRHLQGQEYLGPSASRVLMFEAFSNPGFAQGRRQLEEFLDGRVTASTIDDYLDLFYLSQALLLDHYRSLPQKTKPKYPAWSEDRANRVLKAATRQLLPAAASDTWSDPLSEPLELYQHLIQADANLNLTCLAHSGDAECQADILNIAAHLKSAPSDKATLPLVLAAFAPRIEAAVSERVKAHHGDDLLRLIEVTSQTPLSWPHLDHLTDYIGQPLPVSEIPNYLAYQIPAPKAVGWLEKGLRQGHQMKIAENLQAAIPELDANLTAYLAFAWSYFPSSKEVLERVGNDTGQWQRIALHQQAGWQVDQIAKLIIDGSPLPEVPTPPSLQDETPDEHALPSLRKAEAEVKLAVDAFAIAPNWYYPSPAELESEPATLSL